MPHGQTNIVRIGKEVTRGLAVAGTMTVPLRGEGIKIGFTNHLGQIFASSTFPSQTDSVALGLTPSVRMELDVNLATIRDTILMALMRTAGALPGLSIEETSMAVGSQVASGCVNRSLELSFQRGENPDAGALLAAVMEFAAMKVGAPTVAITAGTYGVGHRFPLSRATLTLNSVAALEVLSWSWKVSNTLALGPHNASREVMWIEDGVEGHQFTLTARFAAEAWRNLVKNATEHAATFVLATGTSLETVSLACGKCQAETHELQGGDGTVTEQIVLTPFHTGAARPVVPTFGAAIGASVMGLS